MDSGTEAAVKIDEVTGLKEAAENSNQNEEQKVLQNEENEEEKALQNEENEEQKALQHEENEEQKALQNEENEEQKALQNEGNEEQKALQNEGNEEQKALQNEKNEEQKALQHEGNEEQKALQNEKNEEQKALQHEENEEQRTLQDEENEEQKELQNEDQKALQNEENEEQKALQNEENEAEKSLQSEENEEQKALQNEENEAEKSLQSEENEEQKALQNEEQKERSKFRKRPTFAKNRGGWKLASLLLVNQALATLAFFGVAVNLVLFLTRVLEQESAAAANGVSIWTGTVYLCSLIGAFLSDSYWGRYTTCAIFQVIFVVGLGLLSFSSGLFLLKPTGCGDDTLKCKPTSSIGINIFYFSIYLIAFGYGGHQPTIATFGSDQFDESNPKKVKAKADFFCYFYFALNSGSLFSNTILVYFEDTGKWTFGFLVSLTSAVVALILYLLGTKRYRYVKTCGNPLPRVAQVFTAAIKKWKVAPANADGLYEVEGPHSAIKGSRKILHSSGCRFLDKAATITEEDIEGSKDPWSLCTITQVEEAKCLIRMLPIWICTIMYSVVFAQMASLFVEQGDVMNTAIAGGRFHLPAASMSAFDICSVLVCTGLYRQLLVPLAGRLSGNPKGLTELQRMGIGLIIAMLAMLAAAATEIQRLRHVIPGQKRSSLSIFWQIPQYVLVGCSEVFMYVGQLEFFNAQSPDGIKSLGSSLCMASISLGNYGSSLLVNMVMAITAKGGNPGWIPPDLNSGHMDRFYFLIAALTAIDFLIYVYRARWYKCIQIDGAAPEHQRERRGEEEDEVLDRV